MEQGLISTLDFRPFAAWRYHSGAVQIGQVIAPPYDVISPAEREILYAKSPYNVVRLILGKEPNFYDHAALCWQEWSQKGVLTQDQTPAIYLYEQAFKHPLDGRPFSRLALVGILKLDESGPVLRHEATFDAPKRDRLMLLEKTKTNLSPIFGLYQNAKSFQTVFSAYRPTPPLFETQDDQGITHRGWAIQNQADCETIRKALADQKILIADGHHRYETALEYQRRMHEKSPDPSGEMDFDFVMMALVASDDPGLLVLPTHRIVKSLSPYSEKEFLEHLSEFFKLTSCSDEEALTALNKNGVKPNVFAGVFGNAGSLLFEFNHLKSAAKFLPQNKPPVWYEVDANLLMNLVFHGLMGVAPEKKQSLIEYTRSSEEAIRAVRQRRAEAAFLLQTPQVDTIRQLAYAGERMPQKTTYFYPKLASGFFFYHHGI